MVTFVTLPSRFFMACFLAAPNLNAGFAENFVMDLLLNLHSSIGATRKTDKMTAAVAPPRPIVIPTCRHILEAGRFCLAATIGGGAYCRAHCLLRVRHRKMARARRRSPALKVPQLCNLQATDLCATRVRVAVAANRMDPQTGRLMLSLLQMSAASLRTIERQKQSSALATAPGRGCKPNQLYRLPASPVDSMRYEPNDSYLIENKMPSRKEMQPNRDSELNRQRNSDCAGLAGPTGRH